MCADILLHVHTCVPISFLTCVQKVALFRLYNFVLFFLTYNFCDCSMEKLSVLACFIRFFLFLNDRLLFYFAPVLLLVSMSA